MFVCGFGGAGENGEIGIIIIEIIDEYFQMIFSFSPDQYRRSVRMKRSIRQRSLVSKMARRKRLANDAGARL